MKGIPIWLNTVEDIKNSMEIDKEETKHKIKLMLDNRFSWFVEKKLESKDQGIEDESHKVQESEDYFNNTKEFWQYTLKEDPNAWLFKIGLTVEDAQKLLES